MLEYETGTDEVIVRSCLLLFALVESGGLCVAHPERMLPKVKLDRRAALLGYLRQPGKNAETAKNTVIPTTETEANGSAQISVDNVDAENPANEEPAAPGAERKNDEEIEPDEEEIGMRQPLHLLGRNHLLAFTYFRLKIQKETDGKSLLLLPALPILAELFDESAGGGEEEGEKSVFDAGSEEVRKFLNSLLADDYTRRKAIDEIDKTRKLKDFEDSQNFDLVNLLRWAEELVKKNKPRTVHTYGAQVLRFLTEISPRAPTPTAPRGTSPPL